VSERQATSPTQLAGEVALITGASRGIGMAVALELARIGADVGLVQRGDAAETVARVEALGRRAHVVRADLGDAEAAERAVDDVAAEHGLDGIVTAAGTDACGRLDAVGREQWERVVAVDDQAVRAPAELQTALRRHAIGEEVRLRIDRDGESREVVVRHASDLP